MRATGVIGAALRAGKPVPIILVTGGPTTLNTCSAKSPKERG